MLKIPRRGGGGGGGGGRTKPGGHITSARVLTIVSDLVEMFNDHAHDPARSDSGRKYATTALGIAVDKWTLVSGRPTQIVGFAELDQQRPGVIELARRLATSA